METTKEKRYYLKKGLKPGATQVNKDAVAGTSVFIDTSWCVLQHTSKKASQHLVSRAATNLQFNKGSVCTEDVTSIKNRTFEFRIKPNLMPHFML